MNRLLLWLKLAQGALTPLVVVPVLLGTAYAVYDAYPMRWTTFVLVLFGGTALFVAAMVIVAILELTLGREPLEEDTDVSGMRGAEVMGVGLVSLPEAAAVGAAALAVALACGALLARPAGSFSMGLGFAGLMVAISYAVPGVGLRDLGHGFPELGAFLALGLLPVLGGYAAQTGSFTVGAALASIPMGLYGASIVYAHALYRYRRHPEHEGSSLVMDLGDDRAHIGAWVLPGMAYAAIVVNVFVGDYPISACWALVTFPVLGWKLSRLDADNPQTYAELTRATAMLYAATGLVIAGALVISGARSP